MLLVFLVQARATETLGLVLTPTATTTMADDLVEPVSRLALTDPDGEGTGATDVDVPDTEVQASTGLDSSTPCTSVGIILDLHYVEVAAKQNAMATEWKPTDLVDSIVEFVTTETKRPAIATRLMAMDSVVGWGDDRGKRRLHASLVNAKFKLVTSPSKSRMASRSQRWRSTQGGRRGNQQQKNAPFHAQQGATDVDIVTAMFSLAGAFAPQPRVEHIVLVSGDSDFLPAIRAIHTARHSKYGLRLWICAHAGWSMSLAYLEAIKSLEGVQVMPLSQIFRSVTGRAGVETIDFRHEELLPANDLREIIQQRVEKSEARKIVLQLSGHQAKCSSGHRNNIHNSGKGSHQTPTRKGRSCKRALTTKYFVTLFNSRMWQLLSSPQATVRHCLAGACKIYPVSI